MWHKKSIETVVEELAGNIRAGLTDDEVRQRLERYGPNRITGGRRRPVLLLFLDQLNSMLIYILLAAAAVSAILGETTDTIVIACVILLNALIGVIQEAKAEKSLEALKKLSTPGALLIRNGRQIEVPAEEVVPGDLVAVEAGRILPCDVRLVESANLQIEE